MSSLFTAPVNVIKTFTLCSDPEIQQNRSRVNGTRSVRVHLTKAHYDYPDSISLLTEDMCPKGLDQGVLDILRDGGLHKGDWKFVSLVWNGFIPYSPDHLRRRPVCTSVFFWHLACTLIGFHSLFHRIVRCIQSHGSNKLVVPSAAWICPIFCMV